jgi:anti-sigma factor RsiW
MSPCDLHAAGLIELYFYGELDPAEHARLERHVPGCAECRRALEDLATIRAALSARPDIAAPPGRDWGPFMARLNVAVRREQTPMAQRPSQSRLAAFPPSRSYVGYLAMAALVALVTVSVLLAWRTRDGSGELRTAVDSAPSAPVPATEDATPGDARAHATDPAFAAVSEQHFERSKLVVLGLATKDPSEAAAADWEYERRLAATLLNDTRLYRFAAEERGLASLARVMEDLELVLLQVAMSDERDASALEQLQRVIRKRDLVTKIELVTTTAGI